MKRTQKQFHPSSTHDKKFGEHERPLNSPERKRRQKEIWDHIYQHIVSETSEAMPASQEKA